MDARGNITEEVVGGITTSRDFDAATGRISNISALTGLMQDLSYSFDVLGNLTNRSDNTGTNTFSEDSFYDSLNRLTRTSSAQAANLTVTYDSASNITSKSNMQGAAVYRYGAGAGPHAVTSVGILHYTYDANGSMLSGDGRTLNYTTFDKPDQITKGSHTTQFIYGPNRSRFKRVDTTSTQSTTTLYVGNIERITKPSGEIETKRYIGGKHIITTTSLNPTSVELTVFTDHIGSTYALVNRATGGFEQGMSFDAFGSRRNTNWTDMTLTQRLGFDHGSSSKGFTGHEQLDEVGLIHMNGRVYDPMLGRFITADSIIDGVTNTQGYNRYSYVHNNPLSYTDPSGNFLISSAIAAFITVKVIKALGPELAAIGNAIGSAWCGPFYALCYGGGTALNAQIFGASFEDALKSGVIAGASAYAFSAIAKTDWGIGGKAFASGVTGGVTSVLQGGKFGHGFAAAGASALAGPGIESLGGGGKAFRVHRVAASAIVGGTVSKLTGGKFANGAISAGFAYALGEIVNGRKTPREKLIEQLSPEQRKFVEFLEKQDVFRDAEDPFVFEKIGGACERGAGACIDFEPGGFAGLVDDLGIHEGFQQRLPSLSRPGEFHLTIENFPGIGQGVFVHFDRISPMIGPLNVFRHGLFEVLPNSSVDPIRRDSKVDFDF